MNNNSLLKLILEAYFSGIIIYLITTLIITKSRKKKEKPIKTSTLVVPAIIIFGLILIGSIDEVKNLQYSEVPETNIVENKNETTISLPRYERVETEKIPYAGLVRFVTKVIIEDEVSKEQLISISENIVNEVIEERAGFQALAIHYYTSKELLNYPPILGIYTYAPNGKWEDAGDAKANFANFMGDSSELVEKNWNDKPTELEMEMFEQYSKFDVMDDGIEHISIKYALSREDAQKHIKKVTNWIYK